MKRYEFWARGFPKQGYNRTLYRVALGDLIDSKDRTVFPLDPNDINNPYEWHGKSGSIGFMNVRKKEVYVPKKGTDPEKGEFEHRRALEILTIGIEPDYRSRGHARFLKKRAEELAIEWDLDTVVAKNIEHEHMVDLNKKLGYALYDNDTEGVKYLDVEVPEDKRYDEFLIVNKRIIRYGRDLFEDIGRVILGNQVEETVRQDLDVPKEGLPFLKDHITGSIGFFDFKEEIQEIPGGEWGREKTLTILVLEIQEQHRGKGYESQLLQKAEEVALEHGLEYIYYDTIEDDNTRKFLERRNYQLLGNDAFKKLKADTEFHLFE